MSYSEAITRNDLMGILNNIGYAKDDWTVPNITKNKAGDTEYTTTGGSPKTIMSISHHTNTGRFVILSRAVIKTSRYTSNATLYVDGNYVDSTGYNITNLTTPVTVNPCGVFTGERDKTYTIELKIDAQNSGTTVTALAYNPAQLIAIDILSTQSKGSRILECYPVGSYYETSDSNFNPNTEWGGTWNKETVFGDGKLLFNNDSAEISQTSVTLSESVENYGSVTVCYKDNDNKYNSVDISNPVNKTFGLIASWGNAANYLYYKTGSWKIGTTTLTMNWEYEYAITTTPNVTRTQKNVFAITQVIAYRTMYRWHRTA